MDVTAMSATAFLNAYLAVWLELAMGYIDTLYYKLYGTIYTTEDNETATASNDGSPSDELPDL
jgi:hypothetical protein